MRQFRYDINQITYDYTVEVKVTQVISDSLQSHGILQARTLEWVAFPSPGYLPNRGIEPRSPALWGDSLPAEPQGNWSTGEGNGKPLQYSCLETT